MNNAQLLIRDIHWRGHRHLVNGSYQVCSPVTQNPIKTYVCISAQAGNCLLPTLSLAAIVKFDDKLHCSVMCIHLPVRNTSIIVQAVDSEGCCMTNYELLRHHHTSYRRWIILHTSATTTTTFLRPCPGTTRVSQYQKKHSPIHYSGTKERDGHKKKIGK